MKKIQIIFLLLIIFETNSFSQLAKGTFLLSGTANFNSGNSTTAYGMQKHNLSTLLLSPAAGYFFLPKLVGGIRLQYSDNRDKTVENSGSGGLSSNRTTSLNIGPFARYYLLNQNNKFINVFIDGSYGLGKENYYNPNLLSSSATHVLSILAGPEIYFNNSVGLEFTIGYYKRYTTDFNVTTTGLQAGIGLQVHLGRDNP